MIVDELRRKLVTAGVGAAGASTSATSIFVEAMPDWPGIAIVLTEADGQQGQRHYGNAVPDIERAMVDMLVRSTAPAGGSIPSSTNARTKAQAAYRVLTGISNEALAASSSATPSTYLSVEALGRPYLFDRDDRGRLYYRCIFLVDRMSS